MHEPPMTLLGLGRSAERVVRPRRALRAGSAHAVAVAVAVALGILLSRIDGGARVASDRVVDVLKVVGLGVLSITTLIFSLLFLVVQWAAGNFSHRLTLFRSDPVVWRVFAFTIGVLAFTVASMLTIGSRPSVSLAVPVTTLVLAALTLLLVRRLQLDALRSIQLSHVLDDLRGRGLDALAMYYPPVGDGEPRPALPDGPETSGPVSSVRWRGDAALVEQLDLVRAARAAARTGAVVVLRARVGDTLYRGDVVADVHGGPVPEEDVLGAVVVGRERTFHQDPALAFRLLADIGLRALSPAVNDPATAVQVLDTLEDLLRRLVAGDTGRATRAIADRTGAVRLVMSVPGWEELLRTGLDDVLDAAANAPMVLARCRVLLSGVLAVAPAGCRPVLERRLRWTERRLADRRPSFAADGPTG
ncbi:MULTISPECIES: DUF2254 family protein [unclassified Streptomyces]|uniref:DUF2254 family protein n=1 Tax=unclassified Streptomyces TaxID=2593676 RepID=UPI0011E61F22|nr:DUF2254 family protein [Streptomyces sp. sk2.1]